MNNFLRWWQHLPENIDPVIVSFGSFRVQYYGLMYGVAFTITYILINYRLKHETQFSQFENHIPDLMTYMIIGLLAGARVGYVIFYNLSYYLHHPMEIVLPFDLSNGLRFVGITGMSFHGGLIGVTLLAFIYLRKNNLSFKDACDLFIPAIPLGYTFGRIGNFINGELFGRVTTLPIGMHFPHARDMNLRHPSQLYEAFGEGIVLFFILWFLRNKIPVRGSFIALYLIGYGLIRFLIEFTREPDKQIGFVVLSFSMGQLLCGLMIIAGILSYLHLKKNMID